LLLMIWIILNVLRKFHWDAIHLNLLDLADSMSGKVIRNGFFARPIFHGSYQDTDLTVNFSSDRVGKGRKNLIDISLARNMDQSATISSLDWLKEREEKSIKEYNPFVVSGQFRYGILTDNHPDFQVKLKNEHLVESIEKLHPFRFIFISRQGILFEKEMENLPQDTRHPRIKELIDTIFEFIRHYSI
jgi:hypothetical protein